MTYGPKLLQKSNLEYREHNCWTCLVEHRKVRNQSRISRIKYRTPNCHKKIRLERLVDCRTTEKWFPKSGQRIPNNRIYSLFQWAFVVNGGRLSRLPPCRPYKNVKPCLFCCSRPRTLHICKKYFFIFFFPAGSHNNRKRSITKKRAHSLQNMIFQTTTQMNTNLSPGPYKIRKCVLFHVICLHSPKQWKRSFLIP